MYNFSYQKQHQIFIQHATQQISQIEQQKQQLEQQMLSAVHPVANTNVMPPSVQKQIPSLMSKKISMPGMNEIDDAPPGVEENKAMEYGNQAPKTHVNPFSSNNHNAGGGGGSGGGNNPFSGNQHNFSQMPPNAQHKNRFSAEAAQGNFLIPDMSRPPPGFMGAPPGSGLNSSQIPPATQLPPGLQQQLAQIGNIQANLNNDSKSGGNPNSINVDLMAVTAAIQLVQQQQQQKQMLQQQQQQPGFMPPEMGSQMDDELPPPAPAMLMEEDQIPTAAYYDLPAGLMVPLIRLEDYNYKPLDPSLIRLPPPAPQNERLTNAMAAFYSLPTHDRPRDK